MNDVYTYLKSVPAFFAATCAGDQPRVRPFGAVSIFEGRLYIVTNNQKAVYRQLKENPKLELCAAGADGTWLRVEASAVEDPRREARVQMLTENPSLEALYTADDGLMTVFYLQDATAVFSSFTAPPEIRTF